MHKIQVIEFNTRKIRRLKRALQGKILNNKATRNLIGPAAPFRKKLSLRTVTCNIDSMYIHEMERVLLALQILPTLQLRLNAALEVLPSTAKNQVTCALYNREYTERGTKYHKFLLLLLLRTHET